MSADDGQFVASFVVAGGRLEASGRGSDELHMVLARRLGERLGGVLSFGDYASGVVHRRPGGCRVYLGRLPASVARATVERLVDQYFGDLGAVDYVLERTAELTGDQGWPWEWRQGRQGKAVLLDPAGEAPALRSWSAGDAGAPLTHRKARALLGARVAVDLLIAPDGSCRGFVADRSERQQVAELLRRLDPRLRLKP